MATPMLDYWTVYLLTCPEGGFYVGQTRQRLCHRVAGHRYDAEKGRRKTHLSDRIKEVGILSFKSCILVTANSLDRALEAERHFIEYFGRKGVLYNDR